MLVTKAAIRDRARPKRPVLQGLPASSAAYSMRRLRDDYSGKCVNVRRSVDNASTDIGFAYNIATREYEIDRIALANFVGSQNLFSFSEEFDNGAYAQQNISVAANNVLAPDGATSAETVTENSAASTQHRFSRSLAINAGQVMTLSCFVKRGTGTRHFQLGLSGGGLVARAYFDLGSGTVGYTASATATITSQANGFYRVSLTATTDTTLTHSIFFAMTNNTTLSSETYTGDGTSSLVIWGAQLNVGALQAYSPTSRRNLLTYSETFDNAGWGKLGGVTITPNTSTAPDGTLTADTLSGTSITPQLILNQAVTRTINVGETYTVSVWVRNATSNLILRIARSGAGTYEDATIAVPASSSWQRISVSRTFLNAQTGVRFDITMSGGTADLSVELWGAQLEMNTSATAYQRVDAAWSATRDGNGFVTTWYDQSGNGRNAAQTTAANQPLIVSAGVVNTVNVRPSPLFNGTDHFMDVSAPIALGCISTVLNSLDGATFSDFDGIFCGQTTANWDGTGAAATVRAMNASGTPRVNGISTTDFSPLSALKVLSTNASVTAAESTGWRMGQDRTLTTRRWNGNIAEVVAFSDILSADNISTIERNQGRYYGITVT